MQGCLAVITGAGSGIGAETARTFARAGARVVCVDRNEDAVTALAKELGNGSIGRKIDVAVRADVDALAAEARALGPIDVWANIAGVQSFSSVMKQDEAGLDWGCSGSTSKALTGAARRRRAP